MNKKQRKLLFTLAGALLLLVALLLIVLGFKARKQQQAQEDISQGGTPGITSQLYAYSALSYHNGNTTLSFALDESGNWIWADDPDFPLDDSSVISMLDLLTHFKPQQTITEGETLDTYGLETPFASLTAMPTDGSSAVTLAFGNTTTDGNSYYVLMNGQASPVYIIADTLYQSMSTGIYSMMELPPLPILTAEAIQSISVKGTASVTLTVKHSAVETDTSTWRSGGRDVTENAALKALLDELKELSITQCVDYKPSGQAVTICGFDTPDAALHVVYQTESGAEQSFSLVIGKVDQAGDGRYVRINEDSTIYRLSGDSVATLLSVAAEGLAGSLH